MTKRWTIIIVAVSLAIGALIASGIYALDSYADSRYRDGFQTGQIQGRRDVVDAILINVANEGNVVIRQGDQSITLILEKADGETE